MRSSAYNSNPILRNILGVKWAVRGSSKMARGSVHPSEVLRAVMMELEAIGLEVRGAEVDKKIAQTQATLVAVEAAVTTAGSWMPEGTLHASTGHSDMNTLTGITGGDFGIPVLDSKESGDVDGVVAADHTLAIAVEPNEERESNTSSLIVAAAATDFQGVDLASHAPQQSTTNSTDHPDKDALSAAPLLPPLPASFIDHQASLLFSSPATSLDIHSPPPAVASAPSSSDFKTTTNKSYVHAIAEHSEDLEVKHSVSRSASAVSVTV